jgi:hypothetical protein
MADRYQSDERSRRTGPQRGYARQAEQFQSDSDDERGSRQMGENWRDDDYSSQQTGWQSEDRYDRIREAGRDYPLSDQYGNERIGTAGYGPSRYTPGGGRSFASFTGNDYGGGDFSGGTGAYGQRGYGSGGLRRRLVGRRQLRRRQLARREPRRVARSPLTGAVRVHLRPRPAAANAGFFERAGDEIASWFGDERAARRREQDHRGHGPVGYARTDERIREDASERLTEDWGVDARKIVVAVSNGEITLDGTVPTRDQKRRAEDCVEDLSGVKHVQNNLRVEQPSTWDRNNSGESVSSKTSSSS